MLNDHGTPVHDIRDDIDANCTRLQRGTRTITVCVQPADRYRAPHQAGRPWKAIATNAVSGRDSSPHQSNANTRDIIAVWCENSGPKTAISRAKSRPHTSGATRSSRPLPSSWIHTQQCGQTTRRPTASHGANLRWKVATWHSNPP